MMLLPSSVMSRKPLLWKSHRIKFVDVVYPVILVNALSTQQVHVIREKAVHMSEVLELVFIVV